MPTITPLAGPNYDDLRLHNSGRVLSPGDPEVATHLIFEVSQCTTGDDNPVDLFKVVRLGVASGAVFGEGSDLLADQRDFLAALRYQSLEFICVVANIEAQPLLAFGVQGVSTSFEKAMAMADRAWESLTSLLLGTSNRFLSPLPKSQADALVRVATSWGQIAMMSGHADSRPVTCEGTQFGDFVASIASEFIITLLATPLTSGALIVAHHTAKLDVALGVDNARFEDQLRRYYEGLEHGAFLYQGSVLAASEMALAEVSERLESSFWDSASGAHVIATTDGVEARRLRVHAATFSRDLCPGDDIEGVEPYEFSSYVTLNELATLAHPS
jgi:hypothetical protein